jgi:hypothetical protein
MTHVVVMKRLIGLPLLIRIEILRRSRSRSWSRSFKNRGVWVGASELSCADSTAQIFISKVN